MTLSRIAAERHAKRELECRGKPTSEADYRHGSLETVIWSRPLKLTSMRAEPRQAPAATVTRVEPNRLLACEKTGLMPGCRLARDEPGWARLSNSSDGESGRFRSAQRESQRIDRDVVWGDEFRRPGQCGSRG